MKIQIDKHTLDRAVERGVSNQEIEDVINNGEPVKAKHNRYGKVKVYDYNRERNNKFYKHKRVEVYYIIEDDIIVTVTVYAFYGEWV